MTIESSVQIDSENKDNLLVDANLILIARFILIKGALFRGLTELYSPKVHSHSNYTYRLLC